jgi:flagellar protein FliS
MRYLADAVATATPAQRIVMLYDRLLLDIERAMADLANTSEDRRGEAGQQLRHAQSIVGELWGSLDVSAWSGGPDLANLYSFVITELITADRTGDAAPLAGCLGIVTTLRAGWAQAAEMLTAAPAPAPTPTGRPHLTLVHGEGAPAAPRPTGAAVGWVG